MTPTGFSDKIPTLRLAFDATMLSQYMRDPLSYKWKYVDGWREPRAGGALNWGSLWHEGAATFDTAVLAGATRSTALADAIKFACKRGHELNVPVYGAKGDEAKRCIRSLVRALVWYEADTAHRAWRTETNANGTPAIEVRFQLPLGVYATTGEEFVLCGSFDGLIDDGGDAWVLERKTTTSAISPFFWERYDPNMQTYLYDFVSVQLYPDKNIRGVRVEALQTGVEFCRVETHDIRRTAVQREHWKQVMLYWIRRAEQDALNDSWSLALNSESSTFGSIFKDIQKRDPRMWDALLATDLEKVELWNPLAK